MCNPVLDHMAECMTNAELDSPQATQIAERKLDLATFADKTTIKMLVDQLGYVDEQWHDTLILLDRAQAMFAQAIRQRDALQAKYDELYASVIASQAEA